MAMSSIPSNETALAHWRGDVSMFDGFFETRPFREESNLIWAEYVERIAPSAGPMVCRDKEAVTYFVPCGLKTKRFVGETLRRAQNEGRPTEGVQRSASHVTQTKVLVIDLDKGGAADFEAAGRRLKAAGVAFLAYTTWSCGAPGKGVRIRVLIPLSVELGSEGYAAAHASVNAQFFDGKADKSSASLAQQQGVWAIGPDRVRFARRWVVEGGALSLEAQLNSKAEVVHGHRTERCVLSGSAVSPASLRPPELAEQIEAAFHAFIAVASVDPAAILRWARAPKIVRDGDGRESSVLALAGRLHGVGLPQEVIDSIGALFNNGSVVPPLDEAVLSDRLGRHAGRPVVWPALFAGARDLAAEVVTVARVAGTDEAWRGLSPVWRYLAGYHPRTWAEVWPASQAESPKANRKENFDVAG
jgi:hypothetical protein